MYGSRGTVTSPRGPLTASDVEDGVRVTLGGIGMGCFPMFDMNPHTRAEVLNSRSAFMADYRLYKVTIVAEEDPFFVPWELVAFSDIHRA